MLNMLTRLSSNIEQALEVFMRILRVSFCFFEHRTIISGHHDHTSVRCKMAEVAPDLHVSLCTQQCHENKICDCMIKWIGAGINNQLPYENIKLIGCLFYQ